MIILINSNTGYLYHLPMFILVDMSVYTIILCVYTVYQLLYIAFSSLSN